MLYKMITGEDKPKKKYKEPEDWNDLLDGPWDPENPYVSNPPERIYDKRVAKDGTAPRQPPSTGEPIKKSSKLNKKRRPPFDWNELLDGPWMKPEEEENAKQWAKKVIDGLATTEEKKPGTVEGFDLTTYYEAAIKKVPSQPPKKSGHILENGDFITVEDADRDLSTYYKFYCYLFEYTEEFFQGQHTSRGGKIPVQDVRSFMTSVGLEGPLVESYLRLCSEDEN